ncbi:hypothetical protein DBV15_01343 [Temnothorax longispinosus]|uniref:Odorant receptor 13a n=1 Tax=Temnothorax longispinosus TaxID=300112 RepID=A0A4S2KJJ1_9HYME|nr:hypothetical protein DBV15_01343 [Temnothorax longispinosus]
MDNDWRECININQHLHVMTIKANMSHSITNAMFSFNAIAAVLYFLGDYVVRSVFLTADYNDTLRQLPIKIQLPFDSQQSPMFEFLVVTVLHKILVDMDNDWRECINVDQHLHIMTIKANVSHFCSNVLLSINTIGSALYLLGDDVVRFIFPTEDYNVTIRQLPIKIQFPFETQQSPIFEFFVVSTFLHGMLQVWSIAILNGLIITLVLHIGYLVFHTILADMENDWRECINVDQHLHIMTIKANISHFFSSSLLSFNAIASAFYLLGDYVIRFIFLTKDYNATLRQLPMKIQFPFETQQSPMFECFVVSLFLHAMLQVWSMAILNGLIFALVHHVSGQVDIICEEFRNISRTALQYGSSLFSFGILVERHNRILSLSENIEKLFSFVALMQVVWSTLVICGLGFIIVISIHNETGVFALVKTMFGYFAIIMEVFFICFAGEYLGFKVLHLSGQVDIICQEFENISKHILLHRFSIPSFGMLIEKHNKVILFSENIEQLFSFIGLMQIVWITLVICSLGFVLIISIHNETGVFALVKTMIAYFTVVMEVFMICFSGEYLSSKVLHLSGQIDIICQEFRNISKNTLVHRSSIHSFGMLIEKHNRILSFSENMEKLFSLFSLLQIFWNTAVVCCLGFVFIISIHNETGVVALVKTMFTYLAVAMEVFMICFSGEYLSSKYVYIFGHFDINNISDLIDALSITLAYSLGFLKLISLWSNRRIFHDILLTMEEDWSNVHICDKSVWCIMESNANLSRRCSNVLIGINVTSVICYTMTSLLRRSADFKEDLNISSKVLPIKMEFPFAVEASPLFELLAVGQVLHVLSIASLVAIVNCLIITLVSSTDHINDKWLFEIY